MKKIPSSSATGGFLLALALFCLPTAPALATDVTLETPFGDVIIELYDEETPKTVANFLEYVNSGAYRYSFIHRSEPGFVIQGGGYRYLNGNPESIPTNDPVENEPGISNTRGTIAMAKLSGDPNSATSQWFINLADNTDLDSNNGGFTVFGKVKGNGMDIIDEIADQGVWNLGAPFGSLPLIDYPGTGAINEDYLVMVDVPPEGGHPFYINAGLNDAWYNPDTAGQGYFITVWPETGLVFLSWFTFDAERPPEDAMAVIGDPGHRWLTAQGQFDQGTAVLDVTFTEGGVFDSVEPAPAPRSDGTIILEFSDCETGLITYDIPSADLQGTVPIQRIVDDLLPLCQSLDLPPQ